MNYLYFIKSIVTAGYIEVFLSTALLPLFSWTMFFPGETIMQLTCLSRTVCFRIINQNFLQEHNMLYLIPKPKPKTTEKQVTFMVFK